jgi:diguanylate cyclase (GGDEF)-like protein/PAS domain S-box-containing protein
MVTMSNREGQAKVVSKSALGNKLSAHVAAWAVVHASDANFSENDFNIGRTSYGPLEKEWVIPLKHAVRNKAGLVIYVLQAILPLEKQQQFWHDLKLEKDTVLGLIRDDAYVLSRYPNPEKFDLESVYGHARSGILVQHLKQQPLAQRGIVEGYNSNAQKGVLFGYRRLSHFQITLFVMGPSVNLYLKWWQQVQYTLLLLALLLVGSYVVYRRTVRNQLSWETERELHEKKLQSIYNVLTESEERFNRVATEAPFPMMIHAENGEVLEINKAWSEVTGYTLADIPTIESWLTQAYGREAQEMRYLIERVYGIDHRIDQGEHVIRCKDGSLRTWHFSAAPVGELSDGRRYVVSMAQDVSERQAAQEKIEFQAFHDALTGLPNRLLAKIHLDQAILKADRTNDKVALLFLDLDNFKSINDSLGHVIGDALLKAASVRLIECLRDTDTLSRQGGDEFLIVLNEMRDTESISMVANKLLARFSDPFVIDLHEFSISLSIGVAVYPTDGGDFDTLLKQADTAMYQAKESGRNTYRFHTSQMNVDAMEHLRVRNGLRHALESDEFVLHYQPQINLATGAVVGAEALIRWNHPELGLVTPGRFISIAEDSGLIVPIGEWVLSEACKQAVEWRKAGLPALLMAVNFSAVQFKRGNVEASVAQALNDSGLDPAMLELELTESILIKDTEKVLATVQRLKALGIKLSIDDFGTGYSSLSYLKKFNVDKLKIDQSFVRDMADDPNDAAIVIAIIQMAKSLKLLTIAEGVENWRQLSLLRIQHCDEVQGFYLARPMPGDEFVKFVLKSIAAKD